MPKPPPENAPAGRDRGDAFLDDLDLPVPDHAAAGTRPARGEAAHIRQAPVPPDKEQDRLDVWDRLTEWLLIALLAFGPLALGAVEAWSELVVVAAATGVALLLVGKTAFAGQRFAWTWAYLPILLFLLIVALQLLPLPAAWVARLSPETVRLKTELLGDLPDAGDHLRRVAVTFYAAATRRDLRMVLAVVAVFVVVVNHCRRPARVKRLLGAAAAVGGAAAVLALAQHATRADRIFWTVPVPGGRADAGPFVNHSHFSQFMNLSMGAAVGLLLVKLREMGRRHDGGLPLRRLAQWHWDHDARAVWMLGAVVVFGALAVALSMSRGGMVSTVLAAAVTGAVILLTRRRREGQFGRGQGSLLAVLALVSFACLLYAGFDAVYERFTPKGGLRAIEGGRWQMLVDVSSLWRKFPLLGTGLGTHQYVFPMVDSTEAELASTHVENEYAQLMEETGALGLCAALAFLAVVAAAWGRAVRRQRSVQAASIGLGFGMVAILAHSLSDFGQHIPANAILTAVTCGLLVALGRLGREGGRVDAGLAIRVAEEWPQAGRPSPALERVFAAGAAAALAASLAVTLPAAEARRRAEAYAGEADRRAARLRLADWQGGDDRYVALLVAAEQAADHCPDDVVFRFNLNEYRWHSISRERDPESGGLLMTEDAIAHAARIVEELHAARPLCPTFGATYTLAGQIEAFVLGREREGAAHVRTGYRLDRQDSAAAFVVGQLEASEGNWEASLAAMRRAVSLDPGLMPDGLDLYVRDVGRPDVALSLAAQDPHALLRLAEGLREGETAPEVAASARAAAFDLLKARADGPDASPADLSAVAATLQERGDHAGAVAYWRRALAVSFARADWRLRLAKALVESGRLEEAEREVRVCLAQRPQWPEAKALMDEIEAGKRRVTDTNR